MRRVLEALFRPSSGLNGIFLVLAEIVSDPARCAFEPVLLTLDVFVQSHKTYDTL
jgi:hypothetical protein